jgi:hypothetical protein
MAHRRIHLNRLVFPDYNEWTNKWITRSILATPKWQINAIEGSFYYNEWINLLSTRLDGTKLPQKGDPKDNYVRSLVVGVGVAITSQEYENNKIKVPSSVENMFIKELLEGPTMQLALNQSTLSPVGNYNFAINAPKSVAGRGLARTPEPVPMPMENAQMEMGVATRGNGKRLAEAQVMEPMLVN